MSSRRNRSPALVALVAVVGAAGLTAACSGDPRRPAPSATPPAPDTQIVQLAIESAAGARHFTPSTISVHPGKVRLVLSVTGDMPHTFTSPALGVNSGQIPAGKSVILDFNVPKAGDYPFFCAYHHAQGLAGTITAKG